MSSFTIVTDTSCDMPESMAQELEVIAVPLKVVIADKTVNSTLKGLDIQTGFYDMLRKGIKTTTSSPSIDDFVRYFNAILSHGKDILYIGFSSTLSGTFNVARIAAMQLQEEYPDRKILMVDSLCASMGLSLLIYQCVQKQREGYSIEQVCEYAEQIKGNIHHWFTVDDLNHLKRGGRISASTAVIGAVMNIKPVLRFSGSGKIESVYKARGKRLAIAKMVEQMGVHFNPDVNDTVFISHADCKEDADLLARSITKNYGITNFVISEIGASLGTHAGPGAVALFYFGDVRE
ncbi:MAG: DegV family protein [Lachnospiraceae bacterium]|nr:DegV family protein [Lachnospiraceae bacterium]